MIMEGDFNANPDVVMLPSKISRPNPSCIIHVTDEDPEENLVCLRDYSSWQTLLHAAEIRNYTAVTDLAKDVSPGQYPALYYHRQCRSRFTLKRDLETIQKRSGASSSEHNISTEPEVQLNRPMRQTPSTSRVMEKLCIFCEKDKYKHRQNTREPLVQCTDLRADASLRTIATQKQDDRIMTVLTREIVAAEAHYHRSCYRDYIRKPFPDSAMQQPEDSDCLDSGSGAYNTLEKQAFEKLFTFIRSKLFSEPQVVQMTVLTSKLVEYMESLGVNNVKESTRKHLRRNLEAEFKDSLKIFSDDTGKLLVMPFTLTMNALAIENIRLKKELDQLKKNTAKGAYKQLDHAAAILRDSIKKEKIRQEFPYMPPLLGKQSFQIPPALKRFLLYLLTGQQEPTDISERVQWLVMSFAQDMIYAVSCGKQKPPKQILLAAAIKALTGNVELMTALNRLGHAISYWQVEENETALCLKKLAAVEEGHELLPENIFPYLFTTMAWDNIDILEETATGGGTSHRVNGIIVQPTVLGPHPKQRQEHFAVRPKQRSLVIDDLNLPMYNSGERVGPGFLKSSALPHDQCEADTVAFRKNLLWAILRQIEQENQLVSSWTGFHITVRKGLEITSDTLGYLPTINAAATEMATAAEILRRSKSIMADLHVQHVVLVFDQAIYAKVMEVFWKNKDLYHGIVVRMGTFHIICNVLSILGRRFQDAGLKDLCIESGILVEGSVSGVMEGRQYNRAVRIHKYVYEALIRLAWQGFPEWLNEVHPAKRNCLEQAMELISDLHDDLVKDTYEATLAHEVFRSTAVLFEEYLDHLRNSNGAMSSFWMSYVDMVGGLLLALLRASREGDWILHLSALHGFIPWCFAYDRVNYSRYLPVYYAQMSNLPEENPEVHEAFMQGRFSVQLSSENPFGKIPVDQATEETVNKDTKSPGGVKKYSLKQSAVSRFYLTAEYRSAYLHQFRDMIGLMKSGMHHAELQKSRILKDEAAVVAVKETLENWTNPFDVNTEDIFSISTSIAAPSDIRSDLLKAKQCGEALYRKFKEDRLQHERPSVKFHDPIPKRKLKTFSDMNKQTKQVKAKGRDIILRADKKLFGQMILIAQARKELNMKDVLCHPLGPLPWSLATPEGNLRKTNKSALAREMQKNIAFAEEIPEPSVTIIDGMSLVHKVKGDQKTFGKIASTILTLAIREASQSNRLDIVFDVYHPMSIKSPERSTRGAESGVQFKSIKSGQIVRQWTKFLASTSNKSSLIEFLTHEWMQPSSKDILQNKQVFVTCGDKCYLITVDQEHEVTQLRSSHEEADTRLFLHAAHAAQAGYKSVVVAAEDTDIFVLCAAHSSVIPSPLYQKYSTKTRTRLIDIQKIATAYGADVCQAILGAHAITGCDSVSSFAGKGKLLTLKLLQKNANVCQALKKLGQNWELAPETYQELEAFTCALYGCKDGSADINTLRYNLFCSKKGEIESHQLPPCKDALYKHIARANYQCAIWKKALECKPDIPDPIGHGWKMSHIDGSDVLVIDWMDGSPAPEAVLELLSCNCSRTCKVPTCTCLTNGMKCSDMCKLRFCENQPRDTDSDGNASSDDDVYDEYDY